jgi:hypothetical protein
MGDATMAKLDIEQHYGFRDKSETTWGFAFKKIEDEEGWFAFTQRPGVEKAICIGRLPEREVVKKLAENPLLTQDDLIDLELWMAHHFQIDEFKPKEKKFRKPRTKKETIK